MNSKEVLNNIRTMLGFESIMPEEEKTMMESALLKDGTQIKWDGELAVGTEILVVTAEGEIPAPDATHELENGTLVTTANGVVSEIVSQEEPQIEVEVENGKKEKMSNEDLEKLNEKMDSLVSEISNLKNQLNSAFEQIANHKNAISSAVDVIEKFASSSNEEPIKTPHTPSVKEKQEAELNKFASALKNIKL